MVWTKPSFANDVCHGTSACHDQGCHLSGSILSNTQGDDEHGHEFADRNPQLAAGQLANDVFLGSHDIFLLILYAQRAFADNISWYRRCHLFSGTYLRQ